MSVAAANSLVFWFTTLLTLLLAVFLVSVLRPPADADRSLGQQPPAEHDHPHPRHARPAAAPPAAAAPALPLPKRGPDPAGHARPAAPGRPVGTWPPVFDRPPWEPAPAPTG